MHCVCRNRVRERASIDGGLELQDVQTSADGTRKLLFKVTVRCLHHAERRRDFGLYFPRALAHILNHGLSYKFDRLAWVGDSHNIVRRLHAGTTLRTYRMKCTGFFLLRAQLSKIQHPQNAAAATLVLPRFKLVLSFGEEASLTVRYLQEGKAKGSTIESVLIPVMREGGWKPRMTLCVSSQVGNWLCSHLPPCFIIMGQKQ